MIDYELAQLELRTMRSAWLALAERWELSSKERLAMFPAGGEEAGQPPRDTETRMRMLIEIGYRVRLPDDALYEWLRVASPVLGWVAPLDVMAGSLAELRAFRRIVEEGFAS